MGYIRHHAIVVTGTYGDWAKLAHAEALHLGFSVSEVCEPTINDTRSFCVFPDGSKEGWADSDDGDARREAFVTWLRGILYEDGSSPLQWAEVQYGDDNGETKIVRDSDEARRTKSANS